MSVQKDSVSDAKFEQPAYDVSSCGLTLQELAFLAGTTIETVAELADLDLITPSAQSETILFGTETVLTVRRILRLHRHLHLNFDSIALIFDLLERIDQLEKRLNELEK